MKQRNKRDIRDFIYIFQILIRILLVFLPQTGYIHPDEIFQSVEVLAGIMYLFLKSKTVHFWQKHLLVFLTAYLLF